MQSETECNKFAVIVVSVCGFQGKEKYRIARLEKLVKKTSSGRLGALT